MAKIVRDLKRFRNKHFTLSFSGLKRYFLRVTALLRKYDGPSQALPFAAPVAAPSSALTAITRRGV